MWLPSILLFVLGLMLLSIPAHAVKPGSNPTVDLSSVRQNWDKKLSLILDSRFLQISAISRKR
jgi:hypothetical protein